MDKVIWVLAVLLFILHQDFWFWDNDTLIGGFMPIGLGYHALYSILAAGLWAFCCQVAWPTELEAFADEEDADSAESQAAEPSAGTPEAEADKIGAKDADAAPASEGADTPNS